MPYVCKTLVVIINSVRRKGIYILKVFIKMLDAGFKQLMSGCLCILLPGFNLFLNTVCAVDNPDAVDFIAAFETREKPISPLLITRIMVIEIL